MAEAKENKAEKATVDENTGSREFASGSEPSGVCNSKIRIIVGLTGQSSNQFWDEIAN